MSGPALSTQILVSLKEEIRMLEKETARGNYGRLEEFTKMQGQLFGMERAYEICRQAISEQDDD